MSKPNVEQLPWPSNAFKDVDPNSPLDAEWGYLSFDPCSTRPVFDTSRRPSDSEILSSAACASIVLSRKSGGKA